MKVYVLEIDNGMEYDSADHQIEGIFKSYRSASNYLLNKGFHPFAEKDMTDGEYYLCFEKEDKRKDKNIEAWIFEMEVME